MGFEAGKDVVLKLTDNGDTERTLTSYVLALRASFPGHKLIDVTTMGKSGHKWASDELEDNSFEVDFLFDPTADTGPWAVLKSLRGATSAKAFEIGPYGSVASSVKITGNCWLENLPLEMAIGDMIKMSGVAFKVDETITIGAY